MRGGAVESIGDRIREIRRSRKMTQKAFSASLGIVQGFICSIEKGRKVPSNTLVIALQNLYEINSQWLESGVGEMYQKSRPVLPSVPVNAIPLYQVAPVSLESTSANVVAEYISLPQFTPGCFAFTYSGDFMSPTIRDGDIVVVKPDTEPVSGEIILIVGQWGESFLRRFRRKGDEVFCSADNSSYSSFKPDPTSKILGTVQAVWRRIKI
ncbi:MAG: helix-turn-helix domain-containing protein [Geobacteraceae bacterium]|nr:helix-turn-helix domain-containing protein [Geobacteraceae bacterium]